MIDENKLKEQLFTLVEQIGDERLHIDAVVYLIDDAPAVDAVPVRRGRWVPKFNGNFKGGVYWYECSECGHTVPGGLQSGKIFCENCGADMRKDGDDGKAD